MGLPFPYVVADDATQGNFDYLKQQFPMSRRNIKVEDATLVGAVGAPAFAGTWVNFDTVYQGARYWRDSAGSVHVEGLVKSGTIGTTVFTLPAGYRPSKPLVFAADTNSGHGRVDVTDAGLVIAVSGGVTYFSLSGIHFKQEQ